MCDLYLFLLFVLFCCNLFSGVNDFAPCMAACGIIKFVDFASLDFFSPLGGKSLLLSNFIVVRFIES